MKYPIVQSLSTQLVQYCIANSNGASAAFDLFKARIPQFKLQATEILNRYEELFANKKIFYMNIFTNLISPEI